MQQSETRDQLVLRATRGNAEAAAFLNTIFAVLHLWDDLIDRDKPLDANVIHEGLWMALIMLPRNKFYQTYFSELNPLLAVAIQNWLAANVMENQQLSGDLPIAFILRSSYADLLTHTALLCGGFEWARDITPEARRLWHAETYGGYLANLEQERIAREEHQDVL